MSFTIKTDTVVVKREGGQVLPQTSPVNRELYYGHDTVDDNTSKTRGIGIPIANRIEGRIIYGCTIKRSGEDGDAVCCMLYG